MLLSYAAQARETQAVLVVGDRRWSDRSLRSANEARAFYCWVDTCLLYGKTATRPPPPPARNAPGDRIMVRAAGRRGFKGHSISTAVGRVS